MYNSQFTDLLDPGGAKDVLAVEEGKNFMFVRAAKILPAGSAAALLSAVATGAAYRATGATNMNDASSRSHAILNLMLSKGKPENGTSICLVDLAGSERLKRSGATGSAMTEAVNINGALSALGRVVTSLVENDGKRSKHIPYKDNELTQLLRSGVGGNAHTALVCCVTAAADSLDESLNTLRFAAQASHVKNKVAKSEEKSAAAAEEKKMRASGNQPELGADGRATIPLKSGPLAVCGVWGDDAPHALICISGAAKDPKSPQAKAGVPDPFFDVELIKAQFQRVLVLESTLTTDPASFIQKEKDPTEPVKKILELIDWLGCSKVVLWGRDAGAVVAGCFKTKHPKRVSHLFMEAAEFNVDAAKYKAICKKDPNYCISGITGAWMYVVDFGTGGINADHLKVTGKSNHLLWPYQRAGVSLKVGTKGKSIESTLGMWFEKALKTKMMQTHNLPDEEIVQLVVAKLKGKAAAGGRGKAAAAKAPVAAGGPVGGKPAAGGGSSSRLAATSSRAADRAAAKAGGAPSKAMADKSAKSRLAAAGRPPAQAKAVKAGGSGLPSVKK